MSTDASSPATAAAEETPAAAAAGAATSAAETVPSSDVPIPAPTPTEKEQPKPAEPTAAAAVTTTTTAEPPALVPDSSSDSTTVASSDATSTFEPAPEPVMAKPSRTAEIWSTRLHREILALTGEGGDDPAHQHDAQTVGVLPPFVTLDDHTIDISKGLCDVTFRILVEPPSFVPGADEKKEAREEKDAKESGNEEKTKAGGAEKEEGNDKKEGEEGDEKTEEASEVASEDKATEDKKAQEEEKVSVESSDPPHVIVMLDASTGSTGDGTPSASPSSYPFSAPTAMLISGAHHFPRPGSEINDGDYLDLDLDWTPSLHLNDAILNLALKIRESIRRGEPFYAKNTEGTAANGADPGLLGAVGGTAAEIIGAEGEIIRENVVQAGKKVSSFFSSGLTSLREGASSMAAVAGEVVAPTHPDAAATTGAASGGAGAMSNMMGKKTKKQPSKKSASADTVAIGDEIDLSESPWNVCAGMYSCKAIRRPAFVEQDMAKAEAEAKKEQQQSSNVGGSFFSSFKNSAKSVMEESFLMVSDAYIIEIKTNKFSIGTGTVTFVTLISNLGKLKFRREESISLFLKQALDDPLIYMMPESAACVKQMQTVLQAHGVKGKHTNAAMQRSIQTALLIVADIQKKEKALEGEPTVENVNEIMDLCRQAAERFEQAGDSRHKEVMTHMKKFLNNPITVSILNGSYEAKKKVDTSESAASKPSTPAKPVPEGEVLTSPEWMLNEDDDEDEKKGDGAKIADKDVKELGVSGASTLDDILNTSATDDVNADLEGVDDDAMAELDAMFKDADAELADLMKE